MIAYEIGNEALYTVEGSDQACGTALDWVGATFGLWSDVRTTSGEKIVMHVVVYVWSDE